MKSQKRACFTIRHILRDRVAEYPPRRACPCQISHDPSSAEGPATKLPTKETPLDGDPRVLIAA